MSTFNATDFIHSANEREHAIREGKPVPEVKPAVSAEVKPAETKPAEVKPAVDPPGDETNQEHSGRVSRSTRRLLRELGEAKGREAVWKELAEAARVAGNDPKPAAAAADPDPEPDKNDPKFSDYDAYSRELARWEARQQTKKTLATDKAQTEQQQSFKEQVQAASLKAAEDRKSFEDWDAVAAEAAENGPEWNPEEHPTLMGMMLRSDVQAAVFHHFGKNPEELEKMLALTGNPEEQIRQFHRLEGRLERASASEKKQEAAPPAAEKKPPETAAERDAKKARPSEAVAAHGGSAPPTQVSPYLADGKTMNPAWKEQQNQREGRRR